jgi:hypothetical protein
VEIFIPNTIDIGIIGTEIVEPVGQEDQVMEVIVFWDKASGDDMFTCPLDMAAWEF